VLWRETSYGLEGYGGPDSTFNTISGLLVMTGFCGGHRPSCGSNQNGRPDNIADLLEWL
jgi:hypothetical protein